MPSKATTVDQYLAELPPDRRAALSAVREVFRKNIDKDFVEGMSYGMMGYSVPHSLYPPGYHCDPRQALPFAAMASQKGHMSLHMMCLYGDHPHTAWFRAAWAKTGKKLDMGKACIRFKKLEDLALDVIAESLRRVTAKKYIQEYEAARAEQLAGKGGAAKAAPVRKSPPAKSKAAAKPAAKKPVAKKATTTKPAGKAGAARR